MQLGTKNLKGIATLPLSKRKEQIIERELGRGTSRRKIAELAGCSINTVQVRARRQTPPPRPDPPPFVVDEELAGELKPLRHLQERWLGIVDSAQDRIEELLAANKQANAAAYVAGVGTKNLLECAKYLTAMEGLPAELPEDDEEARKYIKRAMWLRTRAGSANATKALAEAMGIKSARAQGVKMSFDLGDEPEPGPDRVPDHGSG